MGGMGNDLYCRLRGECMQVLMLDEPTSGLDSETAVAIMQLMQDLTRQVRTTS